ncbi:MAG TPA: BTAD domain-containing putative transcriptional regulator [Acidimicrobiales bacterium]
MPLAIHLLGRPSINPDVPGGYRLRSRKSWGLLAYLILREHPPSRAQLASLLFAEADDPLRALRWSLSEIRRGLGDGASIEGDPVVLQLPADAMVDVEVVTRGAWADAVALPGLGECLLEGMAIQDAAGFEAWLLSEQRHVAAATEAILHEAALATMSQGDLRAATDHAVRLVGLNPLDENHQALLIRLYRMAGDGEAALRQHAACRKLFLDELGSAPGPAIAEALREPTETAEPVADEASISAVLEAGAAAVSAGAVEAGVQSLRTAVAMADSADAGRLRVTSRLALGEALIHSWRGQDEEGTAILHMATEVAAAIDEPVLGAEARSELGYVDFLRARYDRAERFFTAAIAEAGDAPTLRAKATGFLGSVASDRADYPLALDLLGDAVDTARAVGDGRREAYLLTMLGRLHLLREELDLAAAHLDDAIDLSEGDRWLSFLPWPQAMRGEVDVARGDTAAGAEVLAQAFARSCQLGDPCWEGTAARGLALVAEADGETDSAFAQLADARVRCNRLADPYVWLDVHILDAQCLLGLRHGHPETEAWADRMHDIASRTGMKELVVRALLHRAALGGPDAAGDAEAARLFAADIDNSALDRLLER